jgi:hypothetical protein
MRGVIARACARPSSRFGREGLDWRGFRRYEVETVGHGSRANDPLHTQRTWL